MYYHRKSHEQLIDRLTDWTVSRIDELADDGPPPLVVPLTVTFRPCAVRPSRVLVEFERLYQRVSRLLVNNPERPSKRRLLPFVLAFRDEAHTRPDKHPCDRDFFNRPSVAPHVHSIMVVHPSLADRFLEIAGELRPIWQGIPRSSGDPVRSALSSDFQNGSLHADLQFAERVRRLMDDDYAGNRALVRDDVRKVIAYSAKLMRHSGDSAEGDFFTALPTETNSTLAGRPASARRNLMGAELSTGV